MRKYDKNNSIEDIAYGELRNIAKFQTGPDILNERKLIKKYNEHKNLYPEDVCLGNLLRKKIHEIASRSFEYSFDQINVSDYSDTIEEIGREISDNYHNTIVEELEEHLDECILTYGEWLERGPEYVVDVTRSIGAFVEENVKAISAFLKKEDDLTSLESDINLVNEYENQALGLMDGYNSVINNGITKMFDLVKDRDKNIDLINEITEDIRYGRFVIDECLKILVTAKTLKIINKAKTLNGFIIDSEWNPENTYNLLTNYILGERLNKIADSIMLNELYKDETELELCPEEIEKIKETVTYRELDNSTRDEVNIILGISNEKIKKYN